MTPTLRTKRLRLRTPVAGDVAAVAHALGDYEVARYLTPLPFPYSEADAAGWIARIAPPRPERADRRHRSGLVWSRCLRRR